MITQTDMDALVDEHYQAEVEADLDQLLAGFATGAEHDVVGRPGWPLRGTDEIAGFYRALFADLRIIRWEPVRRLHGSDHVIDEAILHAVVEGRPWGIEGRGRTVRVRFLHIFEFSDGRISRENAWIDLAAIQHQLS